MQRTSVLCKENFAKAREACWCEGTSQMMSLSCTPRHCLSFDGKISFRPAASNIQRPSTQPSVHPSLAGAAAVGTPSHPHASMWAAEAAAAPAAAGAQPPVSPASLATSAAAAAAAAAEGGTALPPPPTNLSPAAYAQALAAAAHNLPRPAVPATLNVADRQVRDATHHTHHHAARPCSSTRRSGVHAAAAGVLRRRCCCMSFTFVGAHSRTSPQKLPCQHHAWRPQVYVDNSEEPPPCYVLLRGWMRNNPDQDVDAVAAHVRV